MRPSPGYPVECRDNNYYKVSLFYLQLSLLAIPTTSASIANSIATVAFIQGGWPLFQEPLRRQEEAKSTTMSSVAAHGPRRTVPGARSRFLGSCCTLSDGAVVGFAIPCPTLLAAL